MLVKSLGPKVECLMIEKATPCLKHVKIAGAECNNKETPIRLYIRTPRRQSVVSSPMSNKMDLTREKAVTLRAETYFIKPRNWILRRMIQRQSLSSILRSLPGLTAWKLTANRLNKGIFTRSSSNIEDKIRHLFKWLRSAERKTFHQSWVSTLQMRSALNLIKNHQRPKNLYKTTMRG